MTSNLGCKLAALIAISSLSACTKHPAATARPPPAEFTGVWSGVVTTDQDPFWQVEDIPCFPGCPVTFHAELARLLDDPPNAHKPTGDLIGAAMGSMVADRMRRSTAEGIARLKASETVDLRRTAIPTGSCAKR